VIIAGETGQALAQLGVFRQPVDRAARQARAAQQAQQGQVFQLAGHRRLGPAQPAGEVGSGIADVGVLAEECDDVPFDQRVGIALHEL